MVYIVSLTFYLHHPRRNGRIFIVLSVVVENYVYDFVNLQEVVHCCSLIWWPSSEVEPRCLDFRDPAHACQGQR